MYQTEPTFIVIACRGSLRVIKGVHPLERANKTMSKPPFIASTNKVKPSAKSLFQHKWRGGKKRGGGIYFSHHDWDNKSYIQKKSEKSNKNA